MTGNGRGNMRPPSKTPPFLVVGLLVALCILAFNYWNLSNKNNDLSSMHEETSRELQSLKLEFRTVSDKHSSEQKHSADLASEVSELQKKVAELESKAKDKDNSLQALGDEKESLNKQLQDAQGNLQNLNQNVEKVNEEKKALEAELANVKQQLQDKEAAKPVCDKKACKDSLREVVSALVGSVGKSAVSTALKTGGNTEVMEISADLLQGAEDVANSKGEVGQQNAGGQPQAAGQGQPPQQPQAKPQQVEGKDPFIVQMQQKVGLPEYGGGVANEQKIGQLPGNVDGDWERIDVLKNLKFNPSPTAHNLVPYHNKGLAEGDAPNQNNPDPSKHEIVPQNIPAPGGEDAEAVVNHDLVASSNISPAAQEDMEDQHAFNLPEDDMDKQAAANEGAEDLDMEDQRILNMRLAEMDKVEAAANEQAGGMDLSNKAKQDKDPQEDDYVDKEEAGKHNEGEDNLDANDPADKFEQPGDEEDYHDDNGVEAKQLAVDVKKLGPDAVRHMIVSSNNEGKQDQSKNSEKDQSDKSFHPSNQTREVTPEAKDNDCHQLNFCVPNIDLKKLLPEMEKSSPVKPVKADGDNKTEANVIEPQKEYFKP